MSYNVCVFCGARKGNDDCYEAATDEFGRELAARGMTLVYGGGKVGLMGTLADAVLELDGRVIGVIPGFLTAAEVVHERLSERLTVDDLFERKALMFERADAFVALPGGIGTFDEILEVIAWRQLRQLRQPIGILNSAGYFDPFVALLQHAVDHGFASAVDLEHLVVAERPAALFDALLDAAPP